MSDIVEVMAKRILPHAFNGDDARFLVTAQDQEILAAKQERARTFARGALTALSEGGWVVVPKVPTREMIVAAYDPNDDLILARFKWEAMLSASDLSPIVK